MHCRSMGPAPVASDGAVVDLRIEKISRMMQVSKTAKVLFGRFFYGNGLVGDSDDNMSAALTELMMPDSLRPKPAQTEMEKYLEAREQL